MELIQTITVGSGGAAAIEFGAGGTLPSGYDDLYIVTSLRQTRNVGSAADTLIQFNGSTTGYSARTLYSDGTSVNSASFSTGWVFFGVQSANTANTFGNSSIYIPNYRASAAKSVSSDSAWENNAAAHYGCITATLWNNTDPITSLKLLPEGAFLFVEGSSASLYGIRKFNTSAQPKATGGAISFDAVNNKWVHVFSTSGTFTPTANITCEYLVVAGGGGGGTNSTGYRAGGGGGGAGGYRSSVSGQSSGGGASAESPLSLTSGTGYTVTVGAGGAAGAVSSAGSTGSNSVFSTVTSNGGGGGGAGINGTANGLTGGSGGGSGTNVGTGGSGTTNQGFAGGNKTGADFGGGGGGGASAVGGSVADSNNGGAGGAGLSSTITGVAVIRAGGGGGGGPYATLGAGGSGGGGNGGNNSLAPIAGTANTGGGGGGTGFPVGGAAGGSGIVIVRYNA
jgi:hypothetical protein